MTHYIIDATTGTVLDIAKCFLVDAEHLGEHDYSDSELGEIAETYGISVRAMAQDTGNGDNKYRYTVSYSPLSIRDEADALLDGGIYEDPEDLEHKTALEWARDTATPEELAQVSSWVMSGDHVWDGFRENLMEALIFVYHELHEEKK